MLATEVQPAPAQPPNTGLVASALRPTPEPGWELGMAWRPERCIAVQGFAPCDPTLAPMPDPYTDLAYHSPMAYRLEDQCTTLSQRELDIARLVRRAEAVASRQIAQELWTGALSIANPETVNALPFVNYHLASSNAVVVTTTGDLTSRIAELEEVAIRGSGGQQVYLHLPVHMVLPLAEKLRRVGKLLLTPNDSVVVADGGYPGTSPAGTGTGWAYATGPVQVRMSPVATISDIGETLDRKTNRQTIWAERVFAATFDPCTHWGTDTGVTIEP